MRYFVEAQFKGTRYAGWQRQKAQPSVQQTIEQALSVILRNKITITGCGRTDAGVHALQYFFHFDTRHDLPNRFIYKLNQYLPADIAFAGCQLVDDDAHARRDAVSRTYRYFLHFNKDPFSTDSVYYPYRTAIDVVLMSAAAALLTEFETFKPFCKTGSDTPHHLCDVTSVHWDIDKHRAVFTMKANRFLRGMVRLVVGMCLNVGRGKISLNEVREAMDQQMELRLSESAPAHGLFLIEVEYPEAILLIRK